MTEDPQTIKDAARYEWLRERWYRVATNTYVDSGGVRCVDAVTLLPAFKDIPFDPQSLDQAIDAAIQAEGPSAILAALDRAGANEHE